LILAGPKPKLPAAFQSVLREGSAVSRFRIVAVACCLVFSISTADARPAKGDGGSACASPEQIRAAQVRQLHDQFQVAALNCRGDDSTLHEKWSSYVSRFSGTMSENAQILRGLFKSQAGFDRYNTKVTNYESVRVHEVDDYCVSRSQMFDQVLSMSPSQFGDFAATTIGRPDHVTPCGEGGKKSKSKSKSDAPSHHKPATNGTSK